MRKGERSKSRNRVNRCKSKWGTRQMGKGNKENNISYVLLQVREQGFERYKTKVKQ